ncbi:MAG: glycosyltransferase [Lachnospiraceae bacterium]|nr:glycosyltransferase [Lachnospiraceae bacterium]
MVSIIVPVYNGEKYIDACMECVLAQTYKEIEVIVVNDGSRDNSGSLCDSYAEKDDRIRVIHQENKGLSGARNAGIQAASGKYVIFFDVDDTFEKTVIEDNVRLAEEHQADVVMFCFWYYNVDTGQLKPNAMERLFVGNAEEYFREYLIPTMDTEVFNAPWNKMLRKELLDKNKLYFDTRYPIYEDIIFASNLLNVAEKLVVNNQMYYKYFVRSSGSLITRFYETFFDSVTQYYKNAMRYCERYHDNEKQKKRFAKLYVTLVIMHLKQISCQKDLTAKRKQQLIKRICEDSLFIEALDGVNFEQFRKRLMKKMIQAKMCRTISVSYRILGKLKR